MYTFNRRVVFSLMAVAFVALQIFTSVAKVPDEDDILRRVTAAGEYYYPNMMMRFMAGDSTLTAANYHYLYYGYAYEPSYKPLDSNPDMDKLLLLASGLEIDNPNIETLRSILSAAKGVLSRDPFNPKVWNVMAYAYGALGMKAEEQAAFRRFESILETIDSSGSGIAESSPQHILMFDHALDAMAAKGMIHGKSRIVSRTVEFIPLVAPLEVDGRKVRGIYYDFGRVYRNKPDSVSYKRDRTWQFNNLPVREYK